MPHADPLAAREAVRVTAAESRRDDPGSRSDAEGTAPKCKCYLCGADFKPEHALSVICWPCIIKRAA